MYDFILQRVELIKKQRPLILNITNLVTMDFIANGLLSLGASPIMTKAINELRDLINLANAVVINMGTLDEHFIDLCKEGCAVANELGKPVIFDPVGAGASRYRTKHSLDILEQYQFSIIRGNASEIMALCGVNNITKGVDANHISTQAIEPAIQLSQKYQTTIAITGQSDVIITSDQIERCERGSPELPLVTGSGCLLTAVMSAFHTIDTDSHSAALAAVNFYGACGEIASKQANGPGSFKVHFLDTLAKLPERSDYETA